MKDKAQCPECEKWVSKQGLADHRRDKHNVIEVEAWVPDYEQPCQNCEATPTVTGVYQGKVVVRPDLCGPCCWGEAACIDPENW